VTRKLKQAKTPVVLEVGQVWQLPVGFIEIVKLGKTLAHYRRCRTTGQRGLPVVLAQINEVAKTLEQNGAELIRPSA
jgi:hypothetical protein